MTTEEKAKAYDKALIKGSRLWECGMITRENYEYIFPELQESEEEKIRKATIEFVKQNQSFTYYRGVSKEKCITWLEKQGKKEHKFNSIVQIPDGCHAYIKDRKVYIENYKNERL